MKKTLKELDVELMGYIRQLRQEFENLDARIRRLENKVVKKTTQSE